MVISIDVGTFLLKVQLTKTPREGSNYPFPQHRQTILISQKSCNFMFIHSFILDTMDIKAVCTLFGSSKYQLLLVSDHTQ